MAAEQVTPLRALPLPLLGCAACLAAMANAGGIGRYAPAMAMLWIAAFTLLTLFVSGAVRKDGPRLFWPILALGLLLRAVFFLQMDPGNDVFRYVWEGWLQLHGVNPYVLSPDAPALESFRAGPMAEIWPFINHKEYSAVYPPLTQLVFRAAVALAPTVEAAKGAVFCFELLTLGCVSLLVHRRRAPVATLALYALNPLVLLYFSGEGHVDAIMAGCTALAFVCFDRSAPGSGPAPEARHVGWDCAGFFCLGLAGMAKYLAFALLPFFITRSNVRRLWWAALPLPLFAPFLDADARLLGSVLQFGQEMHFNDVLPSLLLRPLFGSWTPVAAALAMLLTLAGIWLSVQDRLRSAFLASLAVLFWLPTLHPWYLLLPAILLPLFPSRAALACMAVQVWTFAVLQVEFETGVFQEIFWLRNLAALLPLALLLRALWRRDSLTPPQTFPVPATISVIIPVLNEARRMQSCLEALQHAIQVLQAHRTVQVEVLVSDGGSFDDTLDVARSLRCTVLHAPRGRGRQIAAAAVAARGEVLLVLHADSLPERQALLQLVQALERHPDAVHGTLGMRFWPPVSALPGLRWVSLLNALRARLTDISFGDQGQWIRRQALQQMGGVPEQWLMEDVELSLRAKELGPAHIADWRRPGVRVSPRSWREKGVGPATLAVFSLFFRYLAERRLGVLQADDPQARGYYERYYGREARDPWEFMAEDSAW